MRTLLAVVVLAGLGLVPAPARAGGVVLWACHGPDGRALPASVVATSSAAAAITPAGQACIAPGDAIHLGFTDPLPPAGSYAALRFSAPAGTGGVESVYLERSAAGPGYFARTSAMDLEAADDARVLADPFQGPASGTWVELGLRCAAAGCDMTGARLDLRAIALGVRDDAPPGFALGALPSYAAGVLEVVVDARDDGLGLARVSATLAGGPPASAGLGGSGCAELSPGDGTVDLPLADDCPAGRRVTLGLDTARVADGVQPLEVTVTDAAGNATSGRFAVRVINHPAVSATPTPPSTATPAPTATPTPSIRVPAVAVLTAARRYAVTSRGALRAEAGCPALAATTCPVALRLTARLPGRTRATTLATARATVKPGARVTLTLRLSSAARRALARRRTLAAQLTLTGAAPVAVRLSR